MAMADRVVTFETVLKNSKKICLSRNSCETLLCELWTSEGVSYDFDECQQDDKKLIELIDKAEVVALQTQLQALIDEFPSQNYVFCPNCENGFSTFSSNQQLCWLQQIKTLAGCVEAKER